MKTAGVSATAHQNQPRSTPAEESTLGLPQVPASLETASVDASPLARTGGVEEAIAASAEQATDRSVNDPGDLVFHECDSAAQDAGKLGNHGGPRRRVARRGLSTPPVRAAGWAPNNGRAVERKPRSMLDSGAPASRVRALESEGL
ncbi:hypothetical protein WME79_01780 [Sorangium sp. So ce726]|uniref:hypothetical protein n=1 Tax=Sorangium sp. So ce726 TaxID=3133319 RepID=UPI003F5EF01A